MKSLMWLFESILANAGMRCDTDTHRDVKTASRRIKHEGMSFLTITLPAFAKDFERSLELGHVGSDAFLGFRRVSGLPAFLQGFLSQVFDPVSGKLMEVPSAEAILCVRQICLMWKKVYVPCTQRRTRDAIDKYASIEEELADRPACAVDVDLVRSLRLCGGIVWARLLGRMREHLLSRSGTPKHGPGAVQERGLRGNSKFRAWIPDLRIEGREDGSGQLKTLANWHSRLEEYFPSDAFCVPNAGSIEMQSALESLQVLEPGAEPPVRVVTVPKTLKTPRIIAIEPLCMQYTQQSLLQPMVESIESDPMSAGHVNFTDQSINQRLAQEGSKSGKYATIDLSEASDRVSLSLASLMFESCPEVWDAVLSCRSSRAELPDGRVLDLQKFASMGSALCFPVESMVFYTIAILAGLQSASLPVTSRNVRKVLRDIYVYGDDIIIPVDQVETTIALLESFNLKVNSHKSFWIGKFRESCGVDAYDGVNVTPVYVRRLPPRSRRCIPEILSFVSLANQLYRAGWWGTAARVREEAERILGQLPHVQETSPCLGWVSFLGSYSYQRWNRELHRPEVWGPVPYSSKYSDPLDGYAALMKYFLKNGEEPESEKHLERSVRPGSARIKYRWASPA